MYDRDFQPAHINATLEDFDGNDGLGRYVLLPGSFGRAESISKHFDNVTVKKHHRGHHLYFGTLTTPAGRKIDVATVASGMGTPSTDIILNELIRLGAKRFLRVGTSGSLQFERTHLGDFVIATGAVRDDGTSRNYMPTEFPAIASHEIIRAARQVARTLNIESKTHTGIIHSKDSLYAREFGSGPMKEENKRYCQLLKRAGVIASEMEASLIFTACACFDNELKKLGNGLAYEILAGAICVIISNGPEWAEHDEATVMVDKLVEFCVETVKQLADNEYEKMA